MSMESQAQMAQLTNVQQSLKKKGKKIDPSSETLEIDFTDIIDLVIVSHFHLDHCGALPYFTEAVGYNGPIVATPPTKAIIPLMLEDFRKVSVA